MTVSLAELNSRVFMGLDAAAEYLDLSDVHNAVVQRLNVRTMQSRQSSIDVLLGVTPEFTPTVSPYDITALVGKAIPSWLEVRWPGQDQTVTPWWRQVRIVPLSFLNDFQQAWGLAAAFYGDEPASNTAQATQYLAFTYLPTDAVFRIRFDRDNQRILYSGDILLPDNLSELIVLESQQTLIPRVKIKMAMRLRNDEGGRAIAPIVMGALDQLYAQNRIDISPLDALWRVWAYRDRGADSNFQKPTPQSERLYPGGRNNWGSGWGGSGY